MKLYGHNFSFNSNKIQFVANYLGLNYEFQTVDLAAGEQRQEWFVKLNPIGKIPVLVDGDYNLAESNAIIRYLAEKNNSALYPSDLKKRSTVNQWMDFGSIHMGMAVGKILFNTFIYKMVNVPKDETSLNDGRTFLTNYLKVIDAQLKQGQYICGNELSLADFTILAVLDPCESVGFDLSPYANVVAWRTKLQAKDFYKKVFSSYTDFVNSIFAAKA
jgi:glutathione S-transferase